MKYPYRVQLVQESDGECYWVARSESLKGCIGTGDSPEEATRELEENEIAWLETAQELGFEIPSVPYEKEDTYSGKFTVRMSPYVHRSAAELAKKQGISLNQFVNDAIVNYTAEISSSNYIANVVAQVTQDIGKWSVPTFVSEVKQPKISLAVFGRASKGQLDFSEKTPLCAA